MIGLFKELQRRHENREIGGLVQKGADDARRPTPGLANKIAAGPLSTLRVHVDGDHAEAVLGQERGEVAGSATDFDRMGRIVEPPEQM